VAAKTLTYLKALAKGIAISQEAESLDLCSVFCLLCEFFSGLSVYLVLEAFLMFSALFSQSSP
jgi:hypothetical protein